MGVKYESSQHTQLTSETESMTLSVSINNEAHVLKVPPTEKLTVILRDYMQLTGTKVSCGIGRCGACSVFVDDELVNGCLVMAYQVNGKSITTIEGLRTISLDEVQRAFLTEGGFQCGYCTAGMVLAVKALLDQHPNPQEADIKEALAGNLCRCTGYGGIIRVVKSLIEQRQQ